MSTAIEYLLLAVPEALKDAHTCHLGDTLQHKDEAEFHKEASYAAKFDVSISNQSKL